MTESLNKYIPDKDIIKSMCVQNKKLITEIHILDNVIINKDLRILQLNKQINQLKKRIKILHPYKRIFEELKGEGNKDIKNVARNIGYVSKLIHSLTHIESSYETLRKERDKIQEELIQLQIKINS